MSADGNTLAVGAISEDSGAKGVNGDQNDNSQPSSGAVYVFTRTGATWSQQAYIKASNTDVNDLFGYSVGLSADGNTLAASAYDEDSSAREINGVHGQEPARFGRDLRLHAHRVRHGSRPRISRPTTRRTAIRWGTTMAISQDGNTIAGGAADEDCFTAGHQSSGMRQRL